MICPEIIFFLIMNCVRVDPQSSSVYKALSDTCRIISKCDRRYTRFYRSLYAAAHEDHPGVQGPAHGFLQLCELCGCQCVLEEGHILMVHTNTGKKLNFKDEEQAHFKRSVHDFLNK